MRNAAGFLRRNLWATFSAMLSEAERERIGISEDRDPTLCLTRLCAELLDTQAALAASERARQEAEEALEELWKEIEPLREIAMQRAQEAKP